MEDTEVTVVAVESVGEDAIAIDFETPDGFDARPGQFVKVALAGVEESRFYTISSPDVRETFEITVGIDPEGEVGPRLEDLEAGDTVEVSGPFGNAYYEGEQRVLVLAGGPGVGPAIGIAERALDDGGDAAIVYQDAAPIHDERLTALNERGASIAVLAPESPLESSVADVLTDDTQVFVYGFAEFLDDATAAIAAAGGEPDDAKVENFG
ncbi:FAD-dependent oxidoreductase [Halosimplex aquaticum]|uniref:FAD-dependent oxidoreductase n=1 Tax=Halosimplex aquaticum TaxID=3026162 RepID=A0ABD5Y4V7_9EURY|nr:FAD-dependent oxidoreductase [Halosimplex aquaticum]